MGDPISGGSGSTLYGTSGDDTFEVNGAPTLVDGLDGLDKIVLTASVVFAAGSVANVERFEVGGGFKATLSALTRGYVISAPNAGTKSVNIIGSAGADTITGGDGNDTIDGVQGNDVIDGGKGNDTITGGPGYDILRGGDGDDFIQVKRGTGGDYIDGGSGVDRASIDVFTRTEDLTLDLTAPSQAQDIGEGTTIVNIEQISIIGGIGDDHFTGGALADTLSGNNGDDVLSGGGGNDTIGGGNHYDVAVFSGAASDYQITDLGGGSYRVSGPGEGTDTLTGIETLRFADGDRPIGGYTSSAAYWGSANGSATLVHSSQIPDGRGATPGTGFTITGMVRLADGTFWAANEGQANSTDTTYTPSLVHIGADGTTKLAELVLPSSVRAVQGLAIDEAGGRLFYASLSERTIRIVTYSGVQLGTMTLPTGAPNALTYDPTLNALIVGLSDGSPNNKIVQWRSLADNSVIKSLDVAVNPDHLYLDASKGAAGTLYVSYGNAPGIGYVAEFDIASGVQTGRFELPQADAIEGISIQGSTLWAANDAYYHPGNPPKNQILTFTIDQANAYQLVRSGTTVGLDVDLSRHDQTLADGARLVGVERLFFLGGEGDDIVRGGRFSDVLVGNGGADQLSGGGDHDRLVGGAGDDVLAGGTGDDGLEGGGGIDTAVLSGQLADYHFDQLSSTSVRITDLRTGAASDGIDLAAEIERFAFSDGNFSFAELFNQLPPLGDVVLSNATSAENGAAGLLVGTISLSSMQSASIVYTLVDSAGGRFAIDGNHLILGSVGIDFEAATSHVITIRATDTVNDRFVELTRSISIQDRNDVPTNILVTNLVNIGENTNVETKIADLAVVDADTNAAFRNYTYATDDARFEAKNGALYLRAGQVVDFETAASIPVLVTVNDGSGSVTRLITVSVTDVNESAATTYTGSNGNDTITTDADFINGRKGNDAIYATSHYTVTVSGGEGNDSIEYTGGTGHLVAHGDENSDTIIGGGNADRLFGDGGDDTIDGGAGDDLLNGGDGSDTVHGGDGIDDIIGGTGADFLYGGMGNDTISGGTGEDFLEGGPGADRLDGGSEYDTASYASATSGVRANLLNAATNTGEAAGDTYVSIEHLFGSAFNDELLGTDSPNRLSGGEGNDVLSGFGGNDVLLGGVGNDTISGQGGNDTIDGGAGNDSLSGGLTSSDLFIFTRTLVSGQPTVGWGTDVITDFEHGLDHLNLSGSGLSLSSLTIIQQNADTLIIEAETNSSILLLNQSAAALGSSDFYF